TTFENKFGVYIHDSKIEKASASFNTKGQCYLGRPWNEKHRSIFANCEMDDSIQPAGYIGWGDRYKKGVTLMAEYQSKGPGAHTGQRNTMTKVLSQTEYGPYSALEKVFQNIDGTFGDVRWIDRKPEAQITN